MFLVRKVENKSFPCTQKLRERTGQVWRDNSRRVRTLEKNSGETGTYSMYTFNILPLTLKKKMFMTVIQKQNAPLAFSVDHLIWVEHLADTNKLDFNLAPIHEIYKSSQ